MKERKLIGLLVCGAALPWFAMAELPQATAPLSACRPTWTVGDWWTVDSQRYDRGELRPGAKPGWLETETWRFSVEATSQIDGQTCYDVSVRPQGHNHCPYWFVFSFRMSDLLVMRRQLHQTALGKTGAAPSSLIVESSYSKDQESPFVPSDFPNLPLTMPQFAGGTTNSYRPSAFSNQNGQPGAQLAPKASRSSALSMTQEFHPGMKLGVESPSSAKSPASTAASGSDSKSGVVVLASAADKFERQSWDNMHLWHIYAEKWEFGQLVRKSWLSNQGHSEPGTVGTLSGGAK